MDLHTYVLYVKPDRFDVMSGPGFCFISGRGILFGCSPNFVRFCSRSFSVSAFFFFFVRRSGPVRSFQKVGPFECSAG